MTITAGINDILSLAGLAAPPYRDQLQAASWKGVPFFVTRSKARFGRYNAIHHYPFRDAPWVEDLGKQGRRIHLVGFLVGDDIIAQSKRMATTVEERPSGDQDGELVHPIFGKDRYALLDFDIEHDTAGRYAEVEFLFLSSSPRIYPTAAPATADATGEAANQADGASAASFGQRIADAIKQGGAVVRSVVSTVQKYAGLVTRLVRDATSLFRTVQSLPGTFGRFFAGASSTLFGLGASVGLTQNSSATVPSLIAAGAQARANASAAMAKAQTAAGSLSGATTAAFAAQAQSVMTTLGAATTDPADRVRIFQALATFAPPVSQSTAAITTAQTATVDLWRRAALTALARASADYQPSSYDDAAALRSLVIDLLDAEIEIAGDQGEDDVFLAFRALKAAVAADLTARGASLSPIITVSFAAPLPAPVLAQILYQDPSRADELIAEADVRHPLFMPTSFKALAA